MWNIEPYRTMTLRSTFSNNSACAISAMTRHAETAPIADSVHRHYPSNSGLSFFSSFLAGALCSKTSIILVSAMLTIS